MNKTTFLVSVKQVLVGLCLGFLLATLPCGGSVGDDVSSFLDSVQEKSMQIYGFSCGFVQEKRMAMFDEPVIFCGKLYVERKERLRWEFVSPVPSALIFNGTKGLRCNDTSEPVHFDLDSDPVMKSVADQLWFWIGGDYEKLSDLYTVIKIDTDTIKVLPTEQSVSEFIESVKITFNMISLQPEKVLIVEPGGDQTILQFHSYVVNKEFHPSYFSSCVIDE